MSKTFEKKKTSSITTGENCAKRGQYEIIFKLFLFKSF